MDDILRQAEDIAAAAGTPPRLWLVGATVFRWVGGYATVTDPILSWAVAPTKAEARRQIAAYCQDEYPAADGWQVHIHCAALSPSEIAALRQQLGSLP